MSLPTKTKKDINAAIKAGLPEMVGDILQERLKECDNLEKENKQLQKDLESKDKSILDLKSELNDFRKRELEFNNLQDLEYDLSKRMQDILTREAILSYKEESANEKVDLMKEIFRIPFQNRILREDCLTHKKDKITRMEYNHATCNNDIPVQDEIHTPFPDSKTTEEG